MKFIQLASGSLGNSYLLNLSNGNRLLIECGLTWNALKKKLDFNLDRIVGCLVTHSHKDHCRCAVDLLTAGIPIYSGQETLESIGVLNTRNAAAIQAMKRYSGVGFEFSAFPIEHDAPGAMGYVVKDTLSKEFLLFATDTAYLKTRFSHPFSVIAIECSYTQEILEDRVKSQTIHEDLAKRLLFTHMEEKTTILYLKKCNMEKCQEVHLLHCSKENLNLPRIRKRIEERFFVEVVTT